MSDNTHLNHITATIIAAGTEVHKTLGPGLLESTYRACLIYELHQTGHDVTTEEFVPLVYKGLEVDCGLRLDLLVDRRVIVEVKAVEQLNRAHERELFTYLKLTGSTVGLLLNFNTVVLKSGIRQIVLDQ